jgi:hypothetical protein
MSVDIPYSDRLIDLMADHGNSVGLALWCEEIGYMTEALEPYDVPALEQLRVAAREVLWGHNDLPVDERRRVAFLPLFDAGLSLWSIAAYMGITLEAVVAGVLSPRAVKYAAGYGALDANLRAFGLAGRSWSALAREFGVTDKGAKVIAEKLGLLETDPYTGYRPTGGK